MKDKDYLEKIELNIEKFNNLLTKNKLIEIIDIIGNWKKLIWRNLISGIFKGIGIGVGVSFITAIIIMTMQKIITLNIPVISNYIADIVEIVETKR